MYCTTVFLGTTVESAYKAFVPLLENPEPKLIGKQHDGGRKNVEGTGFSWVIENIGWGWCSLSGRITGS